MLSILKTGNEHKNNYRLPIISFSFTISSWAVCSSSFLRDNRCCKSSTDLWSWSFKSLENQYTVERSLGPIPGLQLLLLSCFKCWNIFQHNLLTGLYHHPAAWGCVILTPPFPWGEGGVKDCWGQHSLVALEPCCKSTSTSMQNRATGPWWSHHDNLKHSLPLISATLHHVTRIFWLLLYKVFDM